MRIVLITAMFFSVIMAETTMIKDPKTNLMWEDTQHAENVKITQIKAKEYCRELTLGSFDDWRLPTLAELLSIVDYTRYKPAILNAFSHTEKESFYWTNTAYADTSDEFWGVNFKDGATSNAAEYYDRYVRCVRDIK
ncbi:MAG: hypothetical protein P794_08015 [Epsilonproteobacteria bacterium (ex Lamellibrachia satsuma)]|nr:MAG: hypothetical protein P794_08015 [Epsilonproteobacteria bacterium (ex Lamellibrachia satsuma)]